MVSKRSENRYVNAQSLVSHSDTILSFGLGVKRENYPPKKGKESGGLLVGLDLKRVRKDK